MACALKCGLMSPESCARCGVAGPGGRAVCPRCRGRLFLLEVVGERARWGCNDLTGCGATISVPLAQSVRQAEAALSVEAELGRYQVERRRRLRAERQRRWRAKRETAVAATAV